MVVRISTKLLDNVYLILKKWLPTLREALDKEWKGDCNVRRCALSNRASRQRRVPALTTPHNVLKYSRLVAREGLGWWKEGRERRREVVVVRGEVEQCT